MIKSLKLRHIENIINDKIVKVENQSMQGLKSLNKELKLHQ